MSSTVAPTSVSIPRLQLPTVAYNLNDEVLDLSKHNWPKWRDTIQYMLQMGGLDDYLTGDAVCPPANEAENLRNWRLNDKVIRGYLAFRSTTEEQKFLKPFTTAKLAWDTLTARHAQEGAYSQVLLLHELFSIRFSKSDRLADTTSRIRELVDRIMAIGTPTADTLLSLGLLNAMC